MLKTVNQLDKEKTAETDGEPRDRQQVDSKDRLQKLAWDRAGRIFPLPIKGNLGFEDRNLNCRGIKALVGSSTVDRKITGNELATSLRQEHILC